MIWTQSRLCEGLALAAVVPFVSVASAQGLTQYNIDRPLRVCTASVQNFGARCNGAPTPVFNHEEEPNGPVPRGGWCAAGDNFCGYDIDIWSSVADLLGLEEPRDYERVCLGEGGFPYLLDALAGQNMTYGECDIGVSSITANTEREGRGIMFSRATHRSALAILVHAPLKQRGMWAFFDPLHYYVWVALVVTIIVVPFFVFFFEAVFAKWTAYMRGENLEIANGLVQCLWHSVSHTLSIDVFHVRSLPARIVTAAYAFLVLILTNTYTANLAAFLTVNQLDTTINSVADLRGKAVATVEPYISRLYSNHRIIASAADAWNYEAMIEKLLKGDYAAVISDDTQLISRAYADETCSLHILGDMIEPFDLAFAFRRGFPSDGFRRAVSSALLDLQEGGVLSEINEKHEPPEPQCVSEATEFSETNQVAIGSLWGLWIILAVAIFLAGVAGLVEYVQKRRKRHEDAEKMRERAAVFRTMLPKATSVSRVTSAFWQSIDKSKRQGSSEATNAAAPGAKAPGKMWGRAIAATRAEDESESQHEGDGPGPAADVHTALRETTSNRTIAGASIITASGRPGFMPLTLSDSIESSEILDVFACPAVLQARHSVDGAPGVPPTRQRATRTNSSNSLAPGGRAVSRQTSHGSNADRGSLGVRSTGGRSENLDVPAETPPAEEDALQPAALNTALLHGLPIACMEGGDVSVRAVPAAGAVEDSAAGTLGLPSDLDTELEELNVIVQAVANRVGVLRLTRQQQRQRQ